MGPESKKQYRFRTVQADAIAAVEALSAPKEWYDNMNRVYRSRRDLAGQIMHTLGCDLRRKAGRYVPLGENPTGAEGSEAIADRVLYEAHVFITPGFIFGSNGKRYIRISLCCKDDKLAEALKRIKGMR